MFPHLLLHINSAVASSLAAKSSIYTLSSVMTRGLISRYVKYNSVYASYKALINVAAFLKKNISKITN